MVSQLKDILVSTMGYHHNDKRMNELDRWRVRKYNINFASSSNIYFCNIKCH